MPRPSNRAVRLDAPRCIAARARGGVSRELLAEKSRGGLSVATIKRIEAGVPVYFDTARRFAALLGVSVAELVGEASPAPPGDAGRGPRTIAVLPFSVAGGGADDWIFADGFVDDLTTCLGRHWFPLISRGSTFRYRGVAVDPQSVRAELAVDYVIEGSFRCVGDAIRVTVRLTETETTRQLWADVYERARGEVFAIQRELVATVLPQLSGALLDAEAHRAAGRDPSDLTAWELAVRGSWCFARRTKKDNFEARSLFEQALRRERSLPGAWYGLAMTYQRAIVQQWEPDPGAVLRRMTTVCGDYARLYPNDAGVHVAFGYVHVYSGDRVAAISRLRDAIELDPNAIAAYRLYGQALAMENQPDDAIEQFELAMRLSPRDPERWMMLTAVGLCHFVAERYDDMLLSAERALEMQPEMPFPYGTVAVARAYSGDVEGARAAVRRMLELEPGTSLRGLSAIVAAIHPEIVSRYAAGLERAGVPGGAPGPAAG
jgi:TolB-like protein/Tfp pilus assembly protein PilF